MLTINNINIEGALNNIILYPVSAPVIVSMFFYSQITEEEYFNNKTHSRAMDEFLDLLGARVCLKEFKG